MATFSARTLRLGIGLRALRGDRPAKDIATAVGTSESTLSRLERGRANIKLPLLRALLDELGVEDDSIRERYFELLKSSKEAMWWRSYEGWVSDPHLDHIALESEASRISTWEPVLIPALLQTPDYARAIMMSAGVETLNSETIEARLQVRMQRQDRLGGDHPLILNAIIDESALMRPVGSDDILARQIEHLVKMTDLPNVSIQVVPLRAGAHAGMTGSVTILDYEDGIKVGFEETASGDLFLSEPSDLKVCQDVFDRLRSTALAPMETRTKMAQLAVVHAEMPAGPKGN